MGLLTLGMTGAGGAADGTGGADIVGGGAWTADVLIGV